MENTNYVEEARIAIQSLKRDNQLEPAIKQILSDLRVVSTFNCTINGSSKNAEELIAELSSKQIADDVLYSLHLLTVSATQQEEFNNRELGLSAIRVLFDAKLEQMGCPNRGVSLLDAAGLVKTTRDNLSADKVVFQSIDGSTRRHDELVMERVRADALPIQMQRVADELASISGHAFLLSVTAIATDLLKKTNADFVLLSGPVRDLSTSNSATLDDFFSYVFCGDQPGILEQTKFSVSEWAQHISDIFRGAMKRYSDEGYQTLWPGIAINEGNRPEHTRIGLKSLMRGPGTLFGNRHQFDLRCASLSSNQAFDTSKLNLLLDAIEVLSPVIENALRNNLPIPKFNLANDANRSCTRPREIVPPGCAHRGCVL